MEPLYYTQKLYRLGGLVKCVCNRHEYHVSEVAI